MSENAPESPAADVKPDGAEGPDLPPSNDEWRVGVPQNDPRDANNW